MSRLMVPFGLPEGIEVYIHDEKTGCGYWTTTIRMARLGVVVDGNHEKPELRPFNEVYIRTDELRAMHLVDARTIYRLAAESMSEDEAEKVKELVLRAMDAGATMDEDDEDEDCDDG